MIRHHLGLVTLALSLFACGEKASAKSDKSAAPEEEEKPFTGPLTVERLMKAKGKVDTFDEWSGAYEKLEKFLGKPTRTKDNTFGWAVTEGDTCVYMYAEKDDRSKYIKGEKGEIVGTYMAPMKVEKTGAMMNYDDCLEWAGKGSDPEDPNAAPPPTDGSTIALSTLIDNAIKGRSKWEKQRVKVSAQLQNVSVSTWTSGDKTGESIVASLVVSADKLEPTISCTLKAGAAKPEAPDGKSYAPVVAEGTVAVRKWISGGGKSGLSASLDDCSLTFQSDKDAPPLPSASASKR